MEAKASRVSQRGNPVQAGTAKIAKAMSKASISPSQMSERTRMAATNKDPLDALSRAGGIRQGSAEKRCGLQDVDDDYLKSVVYAFSKQSGQTAAERAKVTADMLPAGIPTLRSGNRVAGGNEAAAASTAAVAGSIAAVQEQQQQQQQQQLQAQIQNQQPPPAQMQAQVQQVQQAPVGQMQSQSSPNQSQAQPPQSPNQDTTSSEKTQSAQKSTTERQGGGGEPELYTTCPNCRATLYLVRNPGDPLAYANQQGDAAQSQPQAQQQQLQQQQ